jgi:putative copper resistance protein D
MADGMAVLVRWIQFLGATLLVGLFGFEWLIARPTVRQEGREAATVLAALDGQLVTLAAWTLIVTGVAGTLDLWRQANVAAGTAPWAAPAPQAVAAVLLHTRYGSVWLARHGCLVLLAVWLIVRHRTHARALGLGAGALAMVALAIVAAASHAASAQGAPLMGVTIDAAHLLATGLWFGGLLPFALCLGRVLGLRPAVAPRLAATVTRRFSRLALLSMSALVGTGVYNAWVQVGSVPGLVGTPYGRWLGLKLGLLLPLLGLAAVNRFLVKPRLLTAAATRPAASAPPIIRRLQRQVLAEVTFGGAILGVVAIMGLTTPARHSQPTWPFSFRLSWVFVQNVSQVPEQVATGGVVALLGLIMMLVAAFASAPRGRWVAGGGVVALIAGLTVALPPLAIDAYPTTYRRPTVPYVTSSIAHGEVLYRTHCVACHGVAGYGDGPAAAGLRPRPADLTAPHTGDHTAGDLFWWVTHGMTGSAMPGFGDRLSESDCWDVINFVRALGSAEQARLLGAVLGPAPPIVAPDLVFSLENGETRSLKDYRGTHVVLLVFFTLPGSSDRLRQLGEVYPVLRQTGAEIIGIPVGVGGRRVAGPGDASIGFPVAVDVGDDVIVTYGPFRRDLSPEGQAIEPPPLHHMELLVDRQGYLRARWIPRIGGGWAEVSRLQAIVHELVREPPRRPAPGEHVH